MPPDDEAIRPELAELRARTDATLDAARPAAVAKRHRTDHRTARENIADLVDAGSFVEYGGLALAAQQARLSTEELVATSPGRWPRHRCRHDQRAGIRRGPHAREG